MKTFILLLVTGLMICGQTRFELSVKKVEPPPPPEQEPGDSVQIDPGTKDIIVTSRGVTLRLPLESDMAPNLTVSYSKSTGDTVYAYSVTNEPTAKRAISGIILQIPNVAVSTVKPPPGWVGIKAIPAPPIPQSILFTKKDLNLRELIAGADVSFTVSSSDLPGLITARFLPLSDDLKPGGITHGAFIDRASPWVRGKLLQLDTRDRHELNVHTIGPEIAKSADGLPAIQSELRAASGLADFFAIGSQLLQASYLTSLAEIRMALQNLGTTQLQRDFVGAIQWRASILMK